MTRRDGARPRRLKNWEGTLKNHVRIALAVTVLATIIAGFPASGQAKNGGQGRQGAPGAQTAAGSAAAAAVADPETTPLEGGTAAVAGAGNPPAASVPIVSTWDFVRMILILALVVGAIYLLFHLLKKGSGRKTAENDLIRVLGTRGLSGNRSMHLIEVGKSVYLVGSSEGGVQLIAEVTDQESLDMVRLQVAEEPAARRRTFQEALADLLRPGRKPASMHDSLRFLKGQRERLRKL